MSEPFDKDEIEQRRVWCAQPLSRVRSLGDDPSRYPAMRGALIEERWLATYDALVAERGVLREALGFYADAANYVRLPAGNDLFNEVTADGGYMARAVLRGKEAT